MIIFDIETTGLDPFSDKVITIQTKRGNNISIWKEWEAGELSVLEECLGFLAGISGNETILGYNNLKFDVPFIAQRLAVYGRFDDSIYRLLYNKKWFDLYQYLGDDYHSMEVWLGKIGLTKNDLGIQGKDIPRLYEEGKFDIIERYIEQELQMCERLFQELGRKFPP